MTFQSTRSDGVRSASLCCRSGRGVEDHPVAAPGDAAHRVCLADRLAEVDRP